jgi:hypothetical protein
MRLVSADSSTGQFPDEPPKDNGDGSTTRVLVRPVFTRGGDKRRRLLVRGGYLAAASCVAYLAMVLVSVTASPSARPAASASPGTDATTVKQVTPERPSLKPSAPAPVVAAPVPTRARVPAPVVVTPAPVPSTLPATVTASAAVTPTAVATTKPNRRQRSSAAAASKSIAAAKTTVAPPPPARVGG